MSILQKANQLPPFVCRIMARKANGLRPLSHTEIARASGLARSTVADLSRKTSWAGVAIEVADRFAKACGVDLSRPAPSIRWLRRSGMAHVRSGNAQQRRFFKRLFAVRKPAAATGELDH